MNAPETNWAGNYQYTAQRIHRPKTVEQIQEIVARASKLKALGTRHSFNDIADSSEDLISLENLNRVVTLDSERQTVTIDGGIKYGELCQRLAREGFALHNMASLPHISVAGACATATHGSGVNNRNLSAAVAEMKIATATGDIAVFSREHEGDEFSGAVVHLGGLGIVTELTLDIVPSFQIRQDVYENLPVGALEQNFDEVVSSAYSVSLFTDWSESVIDQMWVKRVVDGEYFHPSPTLFGATLAADHVHPIKGISAENCTQQMGICGPWHERLPHFRMEFTPSSGEELQSEYFVPYEHGVEALLTIDRFRNHIAPLLQVCEIRTIAADDLWMSPCYKQPCVAFHFTWKQDWPAVKVLLSEIEQHLEPLSARPHWGKLFRTDASNLASLYERLPDFHDLMLRSDPNGKFRNEFLNRYLA